MRRCAPAASASNTSSPSQRTHDGRALVVVVARWFARLLAGRQAAPLGEDVWGDTRLDLPPATGDAPWRNVLTGEAVLVEDGAVRMARLFATLPFAVLEAGLNRP